MRHPSQLYIISPPKLDDVSAFVASLDEVLGFKKGLVGAFQLRLKDDSNLQSGRTTYDAPKNELVLEVARKLKPICNRHEVAFIINDSPELAVSAGADGVHVGQEDGGVKRAREIVGTDMVIGSTCHNSRHLAMVAGEDGADYVAFGAFYPTSSKTPEALEKWGAPDLDILSWWQEMMELPCVAIGGITPNNAKPLIKAGADFIAVISAIWDHKEGALAGVKEFESLF